jgi:hypothetical protein
MKVETPHKSWLLGGGFIGTVCHPKGVHASESSLKFGAVGQERPIQH